MVNARRWIIVKIGLTTFRGLMCVCVCVSWNGVKQRRIWAFFVRYRALAPPLHAMWVCIQQKEHCLYDSGWAKICKYTLKFFWFFSSTLLFFFFFFCVLPLISGAVNWWITSTDENDAVRKEKNVDDNQNEIKSIWNSYHKCRQC